MLILHIQCSVIAACALVQDTSKFSDIYPGKLIIWMTRALRYEVRAIHDMLFGELQKHFGNMGV